MPIKKSTKALKPRTKKNLRKKFQKGTVGNFFVFGILALLIVVGITAVGGLPSLTSPQSGEQVLAITPTQSASHSNLQLKWFGYITLTPTPNIPIHACQQSQGTLLNTEVELEQGFDPGPGGTVNANGIVRIWAKDEWPPFISPYEKVDKQTGAVTPGDQTKADVGTDGNGNFYWEPTLYIVPASQQLDANHVYCDVTTPNCTHFFPTTIKGQFNTADHFNGNSRSGNGYQGPTPDSDASFLNGPNPSAKNPNGDLTDKYLAEYIYNISSYNVTPGTYNGELVIHDGDTNLAIDCFTISL